MEKENIGKVDKPFQNLFGCNHILYLTEFPSIDYALIVVDAHGCVNAVIYCIFTTKSL